MTDGATYAGEMPVAGKPDGGETVLAADETRRRCIVSGEVMPREAMIRFVVGPDAVIVPDLLGKLPGRGLWVRADRSSLAAAIGRGRFAKAARQGVTAPADLPDRVEALLTKRCVDLIALARRAGEAVSGYEKVRAWLSDGRAAVLLEAADGADTGRQKLLALAPGLPVVGSLGAAEIGRAFGRDRAVHAALAAGGLAARLRTEAVRLAGFRPDGGEWGDE